MGALMDRLRTRLGPEAAALLPPAPAADAAVFDDIAQGFLGDQQAAPPSEMPPLDRMRAAAARIREAYPGASTIREIVAAHDRAQQPEPELEPEPDILAHIEGLEQRVRACNVGLDLALQRLGAAIDIVAEIERTLAAVPRQRRRASSRPARRRDRRR